MTDDGHAPTIPDTQAPTQGSARAASRDGVSPDPRYKIRELLGRGGMGEVWLAHDERVQRDVAIKVLRRDGAHDDVAVARFLREARVQGRLEHPAIVPVHELGVGDTPYFVMKRLGGTTLADVLDAQARGDRDAHARWSRRTLLARLVDVCLAIELAHRRGVVHRDLKPANIMLGDLGETYVLDWGLARLHDVPEADGIGASDLAASGSPDAKTVAGTLLGTPGYMSPEQMRGEPIDHRTDIYALGTILFEILAAGHPAVPRGQAFEATLAADCHRPSRAQPDPDVPPELDDACARATAADAAARFESARALADEIQRFLDGDRDLARRRELAAEHAASAAQRFAGEGDAGRADVMRDAGRALALDPTNPDAQQLLARVLLVPPREIPAEAWHKIEEERQAATQVVLKRGALAYGLNLALIPIAILLGAEAGWPFLALGALLTTLIVICGFATRMPRLSPGTIALVLVLHGILLTCTAILLDPLTFAPILGFGSLPIMLTVPSIHMPRLTLGVHLIGIVVPIVLELTGVVPASFHLRDGALVVAPWAVKSSPAVFVGLLVAIIIIQLFSNASILVKQRVTQERAQEQLHVHSWHLAQLVPARPSMLAR